MTKSHMEYEFGTFAERLGHACALFDTEPPEITYEDGKPTITEPLMDWIKDHAVNMDWLFCGCPSALLKSCAERSKSEREILDINLQLEPEVRAGMLAFLQAVVIHGIPMKEAEPLFAQVVKEFREIEPPKVALEKVTIRSSL